jgi:hypothetical protein
MYSHCKSHDLLLHLCNVPIWLSFERNLLGDVADLILNGSKFGMVRWPWDEVKMTRNGTCGDRCMDVCGVVCSQVIPYENVLIISPGNAIHFNIVTDIITKIAKGFCQYANVPDTTNPATRPLKAALHIWGEGWITWLDSKKDDDLLAMAIMAFLLHPNTFNVQPFFLLHLSIVTQNSSTSMSI